MSCSSTNIKVFSKSIFEKGKSISKILFYVVFWKCHIGVFCFVIFKILCLQYFILKILFKVFCTSLCYCVWCWRSVVAILQIYRGIAPFPCDNTAFLLVFSITSIDTQAEFPCGWTVCWYLWACDCWCVVVVMVVGGCWHEDRPDGGDVCDRCGCRGRPWCWEDITRPSDNHRDWQPCHTSQRKYPFSWIT